LAINVKRYLLISVLALAVLLAAIGFGLVPVNLFFAKSAISELLTRNLGMAMEIHGPLRIRFGPVPALTASGITLRFPAADDEALLQIEQLAIKPRLLALLDGDVLLRSINAGGVEFDYCQGGPPNSGAISESSNRGESLPSIAINQLSVQEFRLLCSNEERRIAFLPQHLDLEASAPLNGPMKASVAGRSDEREIHLTLSSGSLAQLLEDSASFPFDLKMQAPDSEISVTGSVSAPLSKPEITLKGELVSGLMERATGNRRISFSGMAHSFSSRPYFEVDAKLEKIDLQRLFDGAEEPGENDKSTDFLPVYELLTRFDARANIEIERLLNAPLPVDNLMLEAILEEGVLNLNRAELLFAGSAVAAEALLDMRSDCVRLTSRLQIADFDLGQLHGFLDDDASLGGRLDEAELGSNSCGDTVQEHLESLQTTVTATGLTGSWDMEKLPLSFHSLQAELNWEETGFLSFEGELLDENLSVSASFASIESIQSGNLWPLTIDARGDASQLTLAGEAGILNDRLDLDVSLNFKAARFGSLHAWIGSNPENTLAWRGQTSLRLSEDSLSINNLDVTLGSSDLKGSISWAGPDSDLPMVVNLQSNKLDLIELSRLFPAVAEPEQAEKLQWTELLTQSEWLEQWFELPPVDIDLSVNQADGFQFDVADAALHASLRDRQIKDGRLNLRLEDIAIEGALEANLQQRPWTVAYESVFSNIDIGGVLQAFDLADNVDAHARLVSMQYTSEGHTLKQLAENSRMQSKIEDLHWAFEAGAENQRHVIGLTVLELTTAPSSASTWLASGYVNDLPLKAWMKTPSLQSTFNPTAQFPLTLVIDSGEDITMLDAVIDRKDPAGSRIGFSVSGESSGAENRDLSQLESPLRDYQFHSDVTLRENELLFSQLQAKVGTSHASGNISIRYQEPNYIFDIDINSPFLETDDFAIWAEDWRNERRLPSEASPVETDPEAISGGIITLISKSVDDFTGKNNFDVSISVDELHSSGLLLGEAQMVLKVDGDEILLDPLQITSPGGNVEASYFRRQVDAGFEYAADIDVEGLEYGGLSRLLKPDSEASGKLFLDVSLTSHPPDADQAINHLQGTLDLAVFPENVQAGFLDLWASNLVFALLATEGQSDKKMNCMVGRFDVENGIMTSKNTFLDSTEVIIRARGSIDLVNSELDLLIAPQSKREKFLSVSTPIAVKGPFSDFSVGVAPGGFLTTMFRWYYGLIYVPWKWLTGESFPPDGISTCYKAMDWKLPENAE
jgi:uncharacterized protein involved in outer membrane biogenesis